MKYFSKGPSRPPSADAKRKLDAANKSGWFGWMWNKKKSVVPPDSDLAKLQRELTPDEKQKLYEAIGYQVTLMIMMLH